MRMFRTMVWCVMLVLCALRQSGLLAGLAASRIDVSDFPSRDYIILDDPTRSHEHSKKEVAYVISVTSCDEVLDGAAVLAESIRTVSQRSNYKDYDFVAIVGEDIPADCRETLSLLGYRVLVKSLPFRVEELLSGEKISEGGGCCGIQEYLKLHAFNMIAYKIVVHLDVDVLLFKPLDNLYDILLNESARASTVVKTIPSNQHIPRDLEFLFVREYTQHNVRFPSNRTKNGVQGAFFIVKPSQERFNDIVRVLKETEYYGGNLGWARQHFGGYWGAAQIQGFLSYYYYIHSDWALELDHCIYNTLGQDIRYLSWRDFQAANSPANNSTCRTGEQECDDCAVTPSGDIFVGHLSSCLKPWWCRRTLVEPETPVCAFMQQSWFELRHNVTKRFGLPIPTEMEPDKPKRQIARVTHNYCQRRGVSGYVKLQL